MGLFLNNHNPFPHFIYITIMIISCPITLAYRMWFILYYLLRMYVLDIANKNKFVHSILSCMFEPWNMRTPLRTSWLFLFWSFLLIGISFFIESSPILRPMRMIRKGGGGTLADINRSMNYWTIWLIWRWMAGSRRSQAVWWSSSHWILWGDVGKIFFAGLSD